MQKKRLTAPGIAYHVVARGNNRRNLFSYPSDYKAFLRFLWYGLRKHPCLLHALCLMTNHLHLLLTPLCDLAMPRLMHLTLLRYASFRNEQHGDTGKLFEGPFKSFPVLNRAQIARVTAYIELNPVRAGLCEDPLDYRWSTYALHVGQPERTQIAPSLWTPSEWAEDLAPADYAAWVAEVRARDLKPDRVSERDVREALADRWLRRPDGTRAT
jgi:putative transposase